MKYLGIVVAILVIIGAVLLIKYWAGRDKPADQSPAQISGALENSGKSADKSEPASRTQTLPNGLKIEDVKVGAGNEAKSGSIVSVHYTGTLTDGTKFDSSRDRGQPFTLKLGQGLVIPGWEQGLLGMKAGGQRKLAIPPALAYGDRGVPGAIPPGATLIFDIELLSVK